MNRRTFAKHNALVTGGAPQAISDFTNGKWMDRPRIFGLGDL